MKLNSTHPVGPMAPTIPTGGSGKSSEGTDSFDKVLNRATQSGIGPEGVGTTQAAAAAKAPARLGEIRAPLPAMLAGGPSPTAERTSALLSLLEDYSQKMAADEVPLKEMESLVGDLGTMAKELAASIGDEPDPRVRELAEQSAALAGIESIKFRRGDYI